MSIMKTVVLAYSGGLDTSVCIPLLSGGYGYDQAITAVADGGQPAPKDIEAGDRNQHKCLWRGLAKDMCDKSSLDNLQIIGGEDDRMEEFGSERGCEWSGFGYTTLYETSYKNI